MDSLDHAREDFEARNLAEARVELGRVALAVRTALAEVGEVAGLLEPGERERIEAALAEGDARMAAEHADLVNAAREQLERVSEPFARRRMERALAAGMAGKSLVEIEASLAAEHELAARRGAHEAEPLER
jgi:molecular chaperone HscA